MQMTNEYEPRQLDGPASVTRPTVGMILSHEWADAHHIDPWNEA